MWHCESRHTNVGVETNFKTVILSVFYTPSTNSGLEEIGESSSRFTNWG